MNQRPAKQSLTKYTDVLTFGKFKGHTVRYILDHEPGYIIWLEDNKAANVSLDIYEMAEDLEWEATFDDDAHGHNYSHYYDD